MVLQQRLRLNHHVRRYGPNQQQFFLPCEFVREFGRIRIDDDLRCADDVPPSFCDSRTFSTWVASVINSWTHHSQSTILTMQQQHQHISLIWSSGTLHAELLGRLLPTLSLSLVVTSHLVLEVFARQLLLSGIVCPLTSVLTKLSQHSADT